MASTTTRGTGRKRIKRGPGKRMVDGKSFRFADEVHYIQRRAAEHDERIVTVGQLVLFSTETEDAWLLDALDHLAARLARDGDPEPIQIEDTDTTFAIGWKGQYRIEGRTFIYVGGYNGRVTAISGYPTQEARPTWIAWRVQHSWLFIRWHTEERKHVQESIAGGQKFQIYLASFSERGFGKEAIMNAKRALESK